MRRCIRQLLGLPQAGTYSASILLRNCPGSPVVIGLRHPSIQDRFSHWG
jgi:hypothetical protein